MTSDCERSGGAGDGALELLARCDSVRLAVLDAAGGSASPGSRAEDLDLSAFPELVLGDVWPLTVASAARWSPYQLAAAGAAEDQDREQHDNRRRRC